MDLPQLRSWLGALQYYSKFIPNFASSADVLFKLATAEKFEWKSEHEECLRKLLSFTEQKAKLQPFSRNSPIRLITDASHRGLGAVLEQEGRPVICASRRRSTAEQGYAQTMLEALAVIWAVKRPHKYLFNSEFRLVTDHEALKFIYDPS